MIPTKLKRILFPFVCLAMSQALSAQETDLGPLVTDRPDATESPATVPKGFLQIETGAFYETFEDQGVKVQSTTLNTTLLRLGVLDNLELRIGWDLVDTKITEDKVQGSIEGNGLMPLLLGGKVAISKEENGWPEIGLLGHLYLPFTAAEAFEPKYTGADVILSIAHTLSDRSSIGYNLGSEWGGDTTDFSYLYTLAYGYAISETFGLYAELYGNIPENESANHFWDAGLTYLVSNSVQLDLTIGQSITDGQDILISGGGSFRIPLKKK